MESNITLQNWYHHYLYCIAVNVDTDSHIPLVNEYIYDFFLREIKVLITFRRSLGVCAAHSCSSIIAFTHSDVITSR